MNALIPVAGVLAALVLAQVAWAQPDRRDSTSLASRGGRLSADDAVKLEDALTRDPADSEARFQLLGYYFLNQYRDPDAARRRVTHVLWVIENQPRSDFAGRPYAHFDRVLDPASYERGKQLWLRLVEQHPGDAQVHGNAAQYLGRYDDAEATRLLRTAKAIEPANPRWPEQLAHHLLLQSNSLPDAAARQVAAEALTEYEEALELTDDDRRFFLLGDAAEAAYAAGKPDAAQGYAEDLVRRAADTSNWNTGNAIHNGHRLLGLLALDRGDLEAAKRQLAESGRSTGSPQLNSFGPDLELADRLLQRGEGEAVAAYLRNISQFWDDDRIDGWIADIIAGQKPELSRFRRN